MKKHIETINILFCGTGGQGVLSAAEVCGVAAMRDGWHVKKSEVHGMAQRGGSVESHLRIGTNVCSPLIEPGQADYLVCFHEGEGKRLRYFLRKNGFDFVPLLPKASQLPDPRFANTFFLGILAAFLPISQQMWFDALSSVIAKRIEENKAVFNRGFEVGKGLTK
jgi:indolepyruvate ferredoxin oxidoreductase beta subunit